MLVHNQAKVTIRAACVTIFMMVFSVHFPSAATETPDLLVPTFSIPSNGYHIQAFKPSNASVTNGLYYVPTGMLLPNSTEVVFNNHTGTVRLAVEIQLWDASYTQHIRNHVSQRPVYAEHLTLPVPFKWMHVKYTTEHALWKHIRSPWLPIAHLPQTVSLKIPCQTAGQCQRMKEIVDANFATDWQLMFAYKTPEPKKVIVTVEKRHLLESAIFTAISEQFGANQYVFVQEEDFFTVVRETVINSLDSVLDADEFLDDEQLHGSIKKLVRKFYHNVTSSVDFTEEMWSATYWRNTDQRPDRRARHLLGNAVSSETADLGLISSQLTATIEDAGVPWNGEYATLTSMKMYCLNMDKLQNTEFVVFGDIYVLTSKTAADYSISLVRPKISDIDYPEDGHFGSISDNYQEKINNLSTEIQIIQQRLSVFESRSFAFPINGTDNTAEPGLGDNITLIIENVSNRLYALEHLVNQTLDICQSAYKAVVQNLTEQRENIILFSESAAQLDQRLEALEKSANSSNNIGVVLNDCNTSTATENRTSGLLPVGSVIAYTGNDTVPACWLECTGDLFDPELYPVLAGVLGEANTPNLGGQFLIGANERYPLASEGGEEMHRLTVNEMPTHSHKMTDSPVAYPTGLAGKNAAHNNMPPYRAVKFLIRAC
ncbi:uncharacterized protein LOC129589640 isoform X2 [Paramacrobiotus metropolitanus]|uniref:uncharacterized protein LOC129589640 isoform X2 n=1 Tax=Paramacrobiotus metropolitanus TaxID=2943436 RepID=UPI0024456F85|nr:uncharacterized protein LOC129589640 isoform X2 [Paramacrobiotus metropolitanus]